MNGAVGIGVTDGVGVTLGGGLFLSDFLMNTKYPIVDIAMIANGSIIFISYLIGYCYDVKTPIEINDNGDVGG